MMELEQRLNVLVLGEAGVGKSTLIRAISGTRPVIGRGQSTTKKIDIYVSDTWPLRLIDARGFEYGFARQRRKARKQMRQFSKEQVKNQKKLAEQPPVTQAGTTMPVTRPEDEILAGVDVVWCCLDGSSRKNYQRDVDLMSRLIRKWRDVPVFGVITKSCFPQDIDENTAAAAQAFAKVKKVNLIRIIPVLAEESFLDDTKTAPPMGVEELCEATLDCADLARQIGAGNRRRMEIEQKRFTANAVVGTAAAAAAAVGAVPFSFADSAVLVPLETMLTKSVLKIYNVQFSGELVSAIVGSAAITNLAKAVITPLKALPIAGSVINGVVAGTIVLALGEAEIAVGEAIYTGKLDPNRMEDIIKTIEEKTADSPVIGNVVKYLQENASSLVGRNAKEIFAILLKMLSRKKLK